MLCQQQIARLSRSATIATVSCFLIQWTTQAQAEGAVLVQWQYYMQTKEFVDLLGKTTEPDVVPAGTVDVFSRITEQCGFDVRELGVAAGSESISAYVKQLLALNNVESLDQLGTIGDGAVFFPVCVPESVPVDVIVGDGEDVSQLLHRYLGLSGPDSQAQVRQSNNLSGRNPRLAVGQTIVVPLLKSWRVIRLKADATATRFIADAAAITNRVPVGSVPPGPSDRAPLTVYDASGSLTTAAGNLDASTYGDSTMACGASNGNSDPLGADRIAMMMGMNDKLLSSGLIDRQRTLSPTSLAIVDLGFDMALVGPAASTSFSGIVDSRVLKSEAKTVEINELSKLAAVKENADHGIAVTFLAAGGEEVLQRSKARLQQALVISTYGYLVPVIQAGSITLDSDANSVIAALDLAARKNTILNLSFGRVAPDDGRADPISNYILRSLIDKALVVVSAGNSGHVVEGIQDRFGPTLPAALGGEGRGGATQITVAALGADTSALARAVRQKAPFSNASSINVDLFAPGCDIVVSSFGDSRKLRSGTSMAAPLVTFVAGLIGHYGINDARTIKNRIMESASFEKRLEGESIRGSILDPEAAISLYLDILDVNSGDSAVSRLFGRTFSTKKSLIDAICPANVAASLGASSIRRLSRDSDNVSVPTYRILYEDGQGRLQEKRCSPATDSFFNFSVNFGEYQGSGSMPPTVASRTIPLTDVYEIIFSRRCETHVKGIIEQGRWPAANEGDIGGLKLMGACG